MDKFSGGLNGSAEEEKVALENRNVQPKIQIVGGKRSRRRKIKSSAGNLKLPARAEKFRDFGGFPAILLNFRLTIRISSGRAEMPPATPNKPQKTTIFSRALDRRPAAEKIPSKFEMSSDSFVRAADKSRIWLRLF